MRKLEAAERAAGIIPAQVQPPAAAAGNDVSEGNPKDSDPAIFELPEQMRKLREDMLAIQKVVLEAPFTLAELEFRMREAGAWPPSPEDRKRRPGELWVKYAPKPEA